MFDINQLLVNRALRITAFSKTTGDALFSLNEIEGLAVNVTTEESSAVNALGSSVAIFERAKNGDITGSSSFLNLGLAAAQYGSDKQLADTSSKILTPRYEQKEIVQGKIVLDKTPAGTVDAEITAIYALASDGTLGQKYGAGTTATATEFILDVATKTITTPTGLSGMIGVFYDYESENVVKVENNASEFSKPCALKIEVLFAEICNPDKVYYGIITSNNAKLDGNVALTISTDGKHPFSFKLSSDYCDKKKNLFNIFIPEE